MKNLSWIEQYRKNPHNFLKSSITLLGRDTVLEEIDKYITNPLERLKARYILNNIKPYNLSINI